MTDLLVVGSLAYDSIQTPKGRAERTLGGSANYFSVSASQFTKVSLVGVVGEDYKESDIKLLKDRNIDTSGMQIQKGKTFFWEGAYEGDMNEAQTKITNLNVFESFNPKLPTEYTSSSFLFLANIAPELQLQVLEQVKSPLCIGLDTMNFWISTKLESLKSVIKKVNVVLINEKEAKDLTQQSSVVTAVKKIVEMGPICVVVKRGEYGFMCYTKTEGFFSLPAYPTESLVDPTGAGDTFAGGFFGYISSLKRAPTAHDFRQACIKGTVMASFTIEDFGLAALLKVNSDTFKSRERDYLKTVTH
jgi:sugar/nucleoside kinase (ribokinase family)